MSKLKKMLAVISTVSLLSVSTGSIASANLDQKSLDSTPAFLQNTGAVMMTDGQMAETRGEFAPVAVYYLTTGAVFLSRLGYIYLVTNGNFGRAIRVSGQGWYNLFNN